jgi:hypothetical protein
MGGGRSGLQGRCGLAQCALIGLRWMAGVVVASVIDRSLVGEGQTAYRRRVFFGSFLLLFRRWMFFFFFFFFFKSKIYIAVLDRSPLAEYKQM